MTTFNQKYYNESYCEKCPKNGTITCKDKSKRTFVLEDKTGSYNLTKYKIDDGIIKGNEYKRCDFGIYAENEQSNILYLVEIKGSDIKHACEQIYETIDILIEKPKIKVDNIKARIVCSRSNDLQLSHTSIIKLKKYLSKHKYDKIVPGTNVLKETI